MRLLSRRWSLSIGIALSLSIVPTVSAQISRPGLDGPDSASRANSNDTIRFSGSGSIPRLGLQQVGEDMVRTAALPTVKPAVSGPEALVAQAHQQVRNGKLPSAIKLYQQAINSRPQLISAHLGLTEALIRQGDYQAAEQECQRTLSLSADNTDALINLGAAFYGQGRIDQAIESFNQAAHNGKTASAQFNLAMCYAHQGNFNQAIEHYQLAITQHGNNFPAACNNLGLVYEATGDLTAAVKQVQQALVNQPIYPLAHYNLARFYANQANYPQAIAELKLAIKQQPNFSEAYLDLGNLYLLRSIVNRSDEINQAIEAYHQALTITADQYPLAHENLALALAKQNNKLAALAELRLACEQNHGNSGETLQNLVLLLSDQRSFIIGNELTRTDQYGNLKAAKAASSDTANNLHSELENYQQLDDDAKDFVDARYCAGLAYLADQQPVAAASEFEQALKLSQGKDLAAKQALSKLQPASH